MTPPWTRRQQNYERMRQYSECVVMYFEYQRTPEWYYWTTRRTTLFLAVARLLWSLPHRRRQRRGGNNRAPITPIIPPNMPRQGERKKHRWIADRGEILVRAHSRNKKRILLGLTISSSKTKNTSCL